MQIQGISSGMLQPERLIQSQTPLKGVKTGDLISARVTSTEGGRVTLTLSDGVKLNAQAITKERLAPGDTVTLEVSSVSDKGTSLRLAQVNGQELLGSVPELEYSLMRMNVLPDSTRVEFAKVLRELGFTLSPDTLSRMGDIAKAFPEMNIKEAALFAASELPLTKENVEAFKAFVEKPANAIEFSMALEKLINENPGISKMPVSIIASQHTAAEEPNNASPLNTLPDQDLAVHTQIGLNKNEGSIPPGLGGRTEELIASSKEWPAILSEAPNLTESQARETELYILTNFARDASSSDKKILLDAFRQARTQSAGGEAGANVIKTAQDMPELLYQAGEERQGGLPREAALAKPHQVEQIPFGKILNSMFAVLEHGEGEAPMKLKDAASGLLTRVSSLSGALEEYGAGTKAASQSGQNIVTQLKMGGELNNLMYAQIPFEISPQERNSAELYILKRDKSRKSIDDSNATVALCLETQNIGRFETLLCVERNELSLQFRVENEAIRDYVKSQLNNVRELDFPAQYHVRQAGVVLQKEAVTPVNAAKTMMDAFKISNTGMLDLSL